MTNIPITLRFPPDVWEEVKRIASEQGRSANGLVVWYVRQMLKKEKCDD